MFLVLPFLEYSPDKGQEFITALFEAKDYGKAITYLDSSVSKQITSEKLQEIVVQTTAVIGDFQEFVNIRKEGNLTFYDCKFDHKDITIQVSFMAEGLINGFYFVPTPPKKDDDYRNNPEQGLDFDKAMEDIRL